MAKSLVQFDIKNAKFAVKNGEEWAAPVSLGTSMKIALEPNTSSKDIYGDGRVIASIMNDKGKTGTLTLNNLCDEYEIAMKRKKALVGGLAEVSQTAAVPHCIYFEVHEFTDDDEVVLTKTWLYNVTSTRPSESHDQTTSDINESSFDVPLVIKGLPILDTAKKIHVEKGVEMLAWQLTCGPENPGFETFGDAVVLPTLAGPEV